MERIFSIFERQLTILEKENNELKNKKIVIEEENEFLKSELAIWKSSTPKKPFFPEKLIDIMPIGIIDFIKKKAIENDLGGLIMDPSILEVKNQIGSGGFSKVYK